MQVHMVVTGDEGRHKTLINSGNEQMKPSTNEKKSQLVCQSQVAKRQRSKTFVFSSRVVIH